MSRPSHTSAVRALALEYKSLQQEPVEGFRVKLVDEDDMFVWEVAIFGPPDTLYQGGYFKVSYYNYSWKLLAPKSTSNKELVHNEFLFFFPLCVTIAIEYAFYFVGYVSDFSFDGTNFNELVCSTNLTVIAFYS